MQHKCHTATWFPAFLRLTECGLLRKWHAPTAGGCFLWYCCCRPPAVISAAPSRQRRRPRHRPARRPERGVRTCPGSWSPASWSPSSCRAAPAPTTSPTLSAPASAQGSSPCATPASSPQFLRFSAPLLSVSANWFLALFSCRLDLVQLFENFYFRTRVPVSRFGPLLKIWFLNQTQTLPFLSNLTLPSIFFYVRTFEEMLWYLLLI